MFHETIYEPWCFVEHFAGIPRGSCHCQYCHIVFQYCLSCHCHGGNLEIPQTELLCCQGIADEKAILQSHSGNDDEKLDPTGSVNTSKKLPNIDSVRDLTIYVISCYLMLTMLPPHYLWNPNPMGPWSPPWPWPLRGFRNLRSRGSRRGYARRIHQGPHQGHPQTSSTSIADGTWERAAWNVWENAGKFLRKKCI